MPRSLIGAGLLVVTLLSAGSAKEPVNPNKESYVKKANSEVQAWNDKLKALEDRSQKSGSRTRQEMDQHVKQMNDYLAIMRKNIEDLKVSNEGTWKHVNTELEKTMRDIRSAFHKAETYFDGDDVKKEARHEKNN